MNSFIIDEMLALHVSYQLKKINLKHNIGKRIKIEKLKKQKIMILYYMKQDPFIF